ncbi:Glycine/D-amino acid oxidase-like deaminating enzyme OS=Castellaniella defragrans OX=75697 GN=HNR28_001310 PE=4 SV=1 [Castellaniella defragrans]
MHLKLSARTKRAGRRGAFRSENQQIHMKPRYIPFWWRYCQNFSSAKESVPETADVVIVGGGYAGLSAAITLRQHGCNVVVCDKRSFGAGASTRNGGAVLQSLRPSYGGLKRRFGKEIALRYYQEARLSRLYCEALQKEHAIECDYNLSGYFMAAHTAKDYQVLEQNLEELTRDMGCNAEMIPRSDLPSFLATDAYCGGRIMYDKGNLNPGKWYAGLLDAAIREEAGLYDLTTVFRIDENSGGYSVATNKGEISTKNVIVATNGYTDGFDKWLKRRIIPIRSQIIATEELPESTIDALILGNRQIGDTRRLHNYFRKSPDGKRILFGGRAGATEEHNLVRRTELIRQQMLSVFPQLRSTRIEYSWSGFVGYTFDHLPHIEVNRGIFHVAGCCGSGVVMQPYLGNKIALKLLGKDSEAETIFDRKYKTRVGYTGTPWFLPYIIKSYDLMDRLKV